MSSHFQYAFGNLRSPVLVTDHKHTLQFANASSCTLLNIHEGAHLTIESLLRLPGSESLQDRVNRFLQSGQPELELPLVYPSAQQLPVSLTISRLEEDEALLYELLPPTGTVDRLLSLLNSQPLAVCILAPETYEVVFANDMLAEFFKLDKKKILGSNFLSLFGENENLSLTTIFNRQQELGRSRRDLLLTALPDHTNVLIQWEIHCVYNEHGALEEFRLNGEDITERTLVERDLREGEMLYRSLFNAANVGIIMLGRAREIVTSNPRGETILDEELYHLTGRKLDDLFVHAIDLEKNQLAFDELPYNKAFESQQPERMEPVGFYRPDESLFWLSISAAPLLDNATGEVTGVIVSFTELTDQVVSDDYRLKLEAELFKLSLATQQTRNAITMLDMQGRIHWLNDSFLSLTGYHEDEVLGKQITTLIKGENTAEETIAKIYGRIKSKRGIQTELLIKTKTNEHTWASFRMDPVSDNDGNHIGFVVVQEDITEAVRSEKELREAKGQAEELNRLKSHFLANLSHELRTPMVGILSFAGLLKEDLSDPEELKMAETIYRSGHRLMETLNLLLDLSKIEANKLEISPKTIELQKVLTEALDLFRELAETQNVFLRFDNSIGDRKINVDPRMLRVIVSNLVSNALKFTAKGGVTVETFLAGNRKKPKTGIAVRDTGIGIPADKQKVIFEGFRQVSEGFTRNFEGVGLGLTITKKFVELLNGELTLESEPGTGSTFTVLFPDTAEDRGEEQAATTPQELPLVLSVEDDETGREVLKLCLHKICRVEFATNGFMAIQMANSKSYDVILMDINLGPLMNGIEVTQAIRQIPGYENTPIVAVTAFAMRGDRDKFLNSGCTHYLAKPFERHTIIQLMNSIFEKL